MKKIFVGILETSGDPKILCVEALDAQDARVGMETLAMSRDGAQGNIIGIQEAVPMKIPDPA